MKPETGMDKGRHHFHRRKKLYRWFIMMLWVIASIFLGAGVLISIVLAIYTSFWVLDVIILLSISTITILCIYNAIKFSKLVKNIEIGMMAENKAVQILERVFPSYNWTHGKVIEGTDIDHLGVDEQGGRIIVVETKAYQKVDGRVDNAVKQVNAIACRLFLDYHRNHRVMIIPVVFLALLKREHLEIVENAFVVSSHPNSLTQLSHKINNLRESPVQIHRFLQNTSEDAHRSRN